MIEVTCLTCSSKFHVYPYKIKQGKGKYCSRKCWRQSKPGEKSPWYKDGNSLANGYKVIHVEGRGQVKEHRYIMEQHIGRLLEKNEHVHHINHDVTDNRIENLELLSAEEHSKLHAEERRKPAINKKCVMCGNDFQCEYKRKNKAKFCSRKCASHWRVKESKGDESKWMLKK